MAQFENESMAMKFSLTVDDAKKTVSVSKNFIDCDGKHAQHGSGQLQTAVCRNADRSQTQQR